MSKTNVKVSEVYAFEAGQESRQEEVDRLKAELGKYRDALALVAHFSEPGQQEILLHENLRAVHITASQALEHAKGEGKK